MQNSQTIPTPVRRHKRKVSNPKSIQSLAIGSRHAFQRVDAATRSNRSMQRRCCKLLAIASSRRLFVELPIETGNLRAFDTYPARKRLVTGSIPLDFQLILYLRAGTNVLTQKSQFAWPVKWRGSIHTPSSVRFIQRHIGFALGVRRPIVRGYCAKFTCCKFAGPSRRFC